MEAPKSTKDFQLVSSLQDGACQSPKNVSPTASCILLHMLTRVFSSMRFVDLRQHIKTTFLSSEVSLHYHEHTHFRLTQSHRLSCCNKLSKHQMWFDATLKIVPTNALFPPVCLTKLQTAADEKMIEPF